MHWTGLYRRGQTEPDVICKHEADAVKIRREMYGARVDLKPFVMQGPKPEPPADTKSTEPKAPKPSLKETPLREPAAPRTPRRAKD
jgi:hypothetical protein